MAFKEDFDQFLDLADFAEVITWNNQNFTGIFDNETYRIEGEGAVPVDVQRPTVMMKTSDTQGMTMGDIISRTEYNVDYTVESIAPDGTGISILSLVATAGTFEARKSALQDRHRNRYGQ